MRRSYGETAFTGLLGILLLTLLVLGACSRGGHKSPVSAQQPTTHPSALHRPATLEEAIAQIDAYEPPAGIDRELFETLRAEVRRQVIESWTVKNVSATADDADPVADLDWDRDSPTGSVELSWSYHNVGDYYQDSLVEISDLTPVAAHYGEYLGDQENTILELIDEDGDEGHNL